MFSTRMATKPDDLDVYFDSATMKVEWQNEGTALGAAQRVLCDNVVQPIEGMIVVKDAHGSIVPPEKFEHTKHSLAWVPKPALAEDEALDDGLIVTTFSSVARGRVVLCKRERDDGGEEHSRDAVAAASNAEGTTAPSAKRTTGETLSVSGASSHATNGVVAHKEMVVKRRGVAKRAYTNKILQLCMKDMQTKHGIDGYGVHNQPCGLQKLCYNTGGGTRKIFGTIAACVDHILTTCAIDVLREVAECPERLFPSVLDAELCPNSYFHNTSPQGETTTAA